MSNPSVLNRQFLGNLVCYFSLIIYCVAGYAFLHLDLAKKLYVNSYYYFMSGIVALWVYSFWGYFVGEKIDFKGFFRRHWAGILVAFILTAIIAVSVEHTFRVLSDESNHAAVSKSLTLTKRAENVTEGFFYYNNFFAINKKNAIIDSRPILFSYLANIIHSVTGYRVENLFYTNLVIFFLILICVYFFLVTHFEKIWVFSAMVCVAAQPVLSTCATSAGHDLCAGFTFMLCLVALKKWMESPASWHRFQFFWISAIAASHVRGESFMITAVIFLLLFALGYLKKEFFKGREWVVFLTPVFYVHILALRMINTNPYESKPGDIVFAFSHFIKNNAIFLKGLVDFNFFIPFATIVNLFGFIGILYGAYYFLLRKETMTPSWKNMRDFTVVALCVIVIRWVILSSYFMGSTNHPATARYYNFFYALFSVSFIFLMRSLFRKEGRLFLVSSIFIFVLYNPVATENRFSNAQVLPRKFDYTLDFLKKNMTKNSIIIVERPGNYVVYNYAAIGFGHANKNKERIFTNFRNYLCDNIYVIQDYGYKDKKPVRNQNLDPKYKLQFLTGFQNSAGEYVKISKVDESLRNPDLQPNDKEKK